MYAATKDIQNCTENIIQIIFSRSCFIIEESVKKSVGQYCAETNNRIELLTTAVNTLMSVLINTRFSNTEELKAVMDKAFEDKVAEIRSRNLSKKAEEPKS